MRRWKLVETAFDVALVFVLAFEASRVFGAPTFWFVALAAWFLVRLLG